MGSKTSHNERCLTLSLGASRGLDKELQSSYARPTHNFGTIPPKTAPMNEWKLSTQLQPDAQTHSKVFQS